MNMKDSNDTTETVVTPHGVECVVSAGCYGSGGATALQLVEKSTGAPYATATVNVPGAALAADEVLVKDYSENEGMLEALVRAGVVEDTGRRVGIGYVEAVVARLLVVVEEDRGR